MSRRGDNGDTPLSLFSFQDIITGITGIMIFILLVLAVNITKKKPAVANTAGKPLDRQHQLLVEYSKVTSELKKIRLQYAAAAAELKRYRRYNRDAVKKKITQTELSIATRQLEITTLLKNIAELKKKLPGKDAEVRKRLLEIAALKRRCEQLKKTLEKSSDKQRVAFIPSNDAEGKSPIFVQLSAAHIAVKTFRSPPEIYVWPNNSKGMKKFRQFAESQDNKLIYFCFLIKPSATKRCYQQPMLAMRPQPFIKPLSKKFDYGMEPLAEDKTAIFK